MFRVTTLVVAAIGVVISGAARAADPPSSWSTTPAFKEAYTELVSGWYFRTDLGFRKNGIGSVDAPPPELVTNFSIRDSYTLGLGGGYKWKWFRADVTLDYATQALFNGDTATTVGYYTAKLDAYTLLANVYLDLGTWAGFTPYIGAGVGTTHLRTHEYSNPLIAPDLTVAPATRWNLSWAAMAGVSYQVSRTILLDVGYRYLKMGDAVSGPEPPAYTTPTYFRDMKAQEIRVGLRWLLD